MKIPFFDYKRNLQEIEPRIVKKIKEVLNSGTLILGNEVKSFEKEFAEYIGSKYAVGVNSGTDAIKIALCALGVKSGDEIITVANTAIPTVSAIRELGAIPVFVDIKEDFTINETLIEKVITKKTRAILPVHLYGKACNMPEIMKIAKKHKLKVVEDCAQSHGAKINGKKTGAWGDISCFSFYPTKNLGAYGDGGIILTSNKKLAETCKSLRMYGTRGKYYSHIEGYNSRLDEMQAGVLNIKLKYLNKTNRKRLEIAKYYSKHIRNKDVKLPERGEYGEHVFHLFVIRVKDREVLIKLLKKNDIGFGIHYPAPIHLQDGYRFLNYKKGSLPITEKISAEIISLPIFPELTKKELNVVIGTLNRF